MYATLLIECSYRNIKSEEDTPVGEYFAAPIVMHDAFKGKTFVDDQGKAIPPPIKDPHGQIYGCLAIDTITEAGQKALSASIDEKDK